MTQQENEKARDLQTLIEEQEKLMLEKFGHIYMESKHFQAVREVSFADITVDIKAFLRKSMKIAYMRGAETFGEQLKLSHDMFYRSLSPVIMEELAEFKKQLQSPEGGKGTKQ